MPYAEKVRSSRARRKTREEKARETHLRILEAAAQVVGEDGYADASISKITRLAGIAQGTFYNYFENRQEVFDALLPFMGQQMLDHIRAAVPSQARGSEREEARLAAFFDYVNAHPAFYRILYEAEVFAPDAHRRHIRILVKGYRGALKRAAERGEILDYSDEELEAVIYVLLAGRAYLAMHYVRGHANGNAKVPEHVLRAYGKLMRRGLFAE